MVITDEQSQELEKEQVFQWASFKVLIVRENMLLMGTRLDADEHGLYEFPGGKAEVGETIDEALAREAKEETGLVLVPGSHKIVGVGQNEKRNITVLFFRADAEEGELNPEVIELGDMRFYTNQELKDLLVAGKMRKSVEPLVKKFVEGVL